LRGSSIPFGTILFHSIIIQPDTNSESRIKKEEIKERGEIRIIWAKMLTKMQAVGVSYGRPGPAF
jgi:hypothetical protein